MKIKIKKIIASILTFMMIFTQVPLSSMNVYAENNTTSQNTIDLTSLNETKQYTITASGDYYIKGCNLDNFNSYIDIKNPNLNVNIYILDDINVSKMKIMSAVTDSDNAIYYDVKNKPGISNLLTIYSILSGESIDALVERYQGVGYGQFRKDLAEVVGNELQKIHDKYNEINQGNYIDEILTEGANKARYMARKKLATVERKIGITIKK